MREGGQHFIYERIAGFLELKLISLGLLLVLLISIVHVSSNLLLPISFQMIRLLQKENEKGKKIQTSRSKTARLFGLRIAIFRVR